MGISLKIVNFDEMFRTNPVVPIIINDLNSSTEKDKEHVDNLISTSFDTDLLSNEPRCACGEDKGLKGGYNLGVMCPNCHTPVKEIFDQDLISLAWMRSPRGVEKLINPMILTQLSQKFTKSGFNIIEWLCNTNYQPSYNRPIEIDQLIALGVTRGYNNFIQNFDSYIDLLFSLKAFKTKKDAEEPLQIHLRQSRDAILSNHIPLPNKSLLVIEKTQVGVYVDPIIVGAVDAIRTICSIDAPLNNFTVRQKENRTAKTLFILMAFYNNVYHDILASKNGLFRKHIFGTRNHFSTRAVISSNTKIHAYDELHISWGSGVTMFKIHLMNKLIKLGFTPDGATALLQECTYRYDKLVDDLLKLIISEAPNGKIPVIFGRNPSLTRGSAQRMFITKVKTDPNDPTLSLSILSVKLFNADFDGDQMNMILLLDEKSAIEAVALAPHKSMYDVNNPRTISNAASIPKPVISTISSWFSYNDRTPPNTDQLKFLHTLAI